MMKKMLLASAGMLALSAGAAPAGPVHPGLSAKVIHAKHVNVLPPKNGATLYDQSSGSNGIGIVSQDFTDSSFPTAYDAQGADDFVVPANSTWIITSVFANGVYFNDSGPASDFNITVYKGRMEGPSSICCKKPIFNETCPPTKDSFGQVTIPIPCGGPGGLRLTGGAGGRKYHISIQAVMAFTNDGEWGWGTNNVINGRPAKWQNPGNGFATGCDTYHRLTDCIPSGEGGDFAFALQGKSK